MRFAMTIVLALTLTACVAAPSPDTAPHSTPNTTSTAPPEAPPSEQVTQQAPTSPPTELPGVHVNIAARTIELDAHVSPRAGEWLELVACYGRSLEHESLVTVDALPSHVHLALLMIGLKPGKPQTWRQENGEFILEPAAGDAVEAFFLVEGEPDPIPANQWVIDQQTGEPMGPMRWLFVGSRFAVIEDQPVYAADINGPVMTLVHFGDEVAAPAGTDVTNRTDEQQWNAREDRVPPPGTAVRLRLTAVAEP